MQFGVKSGVKNWPLYALSLGDGMGAGRFHCRLGQQIETQITSDILVRASSLVVLGSPSTLARSTADDKAGG
jgi:hypothetical protein